MEDAIRKIREAISEAQQAQKEAGQSPEGRKIAICVTQMQLGLAILLMPD